MGRYDRRLRRLAQQVTESLPAREKARLVRMSDEELMAEAARMSVALGVPVELTAHPDAMMAWGTEYVRKVRGTVTEEEWERIAGREPINAGRHYP